MTKTYAIIEIDEEKTNLVSKIICDPEKLPFRYNTFSTFLKKQKDIKSYELLENGTVMINTVKKQEVEDIKEKITCNHLNIEQMEQDLNKLLMELEEANELFD